MSLKDPWGDQGLPPTKPPDPWQEGLPTRPRRRFRHRRVLLLVGGGVLAFIVLSELFNFVQRSFNPQKRIVSEAVQQGAKQLPELLPDAQESSTNPEAASLPSPAPEPSQGSTSGSNPTIDSSNAAPDPPDRPADLPSFIETLLSSVVSVECPVTADDGWFGSGFAFDPSGLGAAAGDVIVTNWHVLEECPESAPIYITTARGEQAEVTVIDSDPAADLAVLTTSGLNLPALRPATAFNQGDWVMAAGNPEGVTGTTTSGSIANVKPEDEEVFSDSVIAPGSSGGPLVNNRGEVIGVTSAIFTSSTGLSISRPITSLCNKILACP